MRSISSFALLALSLSFASGSETDCGVSNVKIYQSSGSTFVSWDEIDVSNCPDLYVYVVKYALNDSPEPYPVQAYPGTNSVQLPKVVDDCTTVHASVQAQDMTLGVLGSSKTVFLDRELPRITGFSVERQTSGLRLTWDKPSGPTCPHDYTITLYENGQEMEEVQVTDQYVYLFYPLKFKPCSLISFKVVVENRIMVSQPLYYGYNVGC